MPTETSSTPLQLATFEADTGKLVSLADTAVLDRFASLKRHPTVHIVREFSIAPIVAGEWTVVANQAAPADAKTLVEELVMPLRNTYLSNVAYGTWDYGWSAYEKLWKADAQGRWYVKKLKPLWQPSTVLTVDSGGDLTGCINYDDYSLDITEMLVNYIGVEGTYWYGSGRLEAIDDVVTWWHSTNDSAIRYDQKLAGAHWVITYPVGSSSYNGEENVDNFLIAQDIVASLRSSGSVIIPSTIKSAMSGLNQQTSGWSVDLKSAYPTSGVAFGDRMKLLDAYIARAGGMPERAIFEAQYGTKADAGEHTDFAITATEIRHGNIVEQFNLYALNPILEANYGPEAVGTVKIQAAKVSNSKRTIMKEFLVSMLNDPATRALAASNADFPAILDLLDIPRTEGQDVPSQTGAGVVPDVPAV